jgi:tetratricopeptide (TPR) repeat protein
VIALDALNCRTGESLAREQKEANSKEDVLKVLGQAASNLRAKLGESLSSIQKFDMPIEKATTTSLEALRAFTSGRDRNSRGAYSDAIPFLKRAIELDPNFASAYSVLATVYSNLRQTELASQYAREAFARRDRVSEIEKFSISTRYYASVTGEVDKTIETYDLWKQMFPRDTIPRNNLAVAYFGTGRFDKALPEMLEVVRLQPNVPIHRQNLGVAYADLNRFDEAKTVFNKAIEQKLDTFGVHVGLYSIAFVQGDSANMQHEVEWAKGKPLEYILRFTQSQTAAFQGKLREALRMNQSAIAMAQQAKLTDVAAGYAAQAALIDAAFGDYAQAKQRAAAAIAMGRNLNTLPFTGLALAIAGSPEAERISAELEERFPTFTIAKTVVVPTIRSSMELQRGHAAKALELLENATPYELGFPITIYTRGLAYLRAMSGTEAAAEFQKMLDHRGATQLATSPLYPLAHLGLARAKALSSDSAGARKSYQDFFAIWKDADADIPVLIQARQEYARLN